MDVYDYIIVGAGSAGCVLANRLSADPTVRVLLLEAGSNDGHPFLRIPIGIGMLWEHSMFDWGFHSEPEEGLGGRRLSQARGKVLGGSSSVNAMVFTRGHPGDYDRWARDGATGWSYDEVLPYFKRLETWEGGASAWRGGDGPIGVQYGRTAEPLVEALLEVGKAAGFPLTDDLNGAHAEGFARNQYSIRNGRRASTAAAYVHPVRRRRNLTVATGALAHRVELDGTRAVGIIYERAGALARARAEREVLVCGGAFNSPQLLMLSGIGPADHLRSVGIEPVVDLPVGSNLQDHLRAKVQWRRSAPGPFHRELRFDRIAVSMLRAQLTGTGPATAIPGGAIAFIKTDARLEVPDLELIFRGTPPDPYAWFPGLKAPYQDGYQFSPILLHPDSRGEIRLHSADPHAPMRITNRFLSAPGDLSKLRDGVRVIRELGAHALLAPYRGPETAPGPQVQSDRELDEWIRVNGRSVSHPAGTCGMGSDDGAVLDPQLRVRGVEGLRVVDASAMPDMVSGHINACVIMLAEKAADLIRGVNVTTRTAEPISPAERATSRPS